MANMRELDTGSAPWAVAARSSRMAAPLPEEVSKTRAVPRVPRTSRQLMTPTSAARGCVQKPSAP